MLNALWEKDEGVIKIEKSSTFLYKMEVFQSRAKKSDFKSRTFEVRLFFSYKTGLNLHPTQKKSTFVDFFQFLSPLVLFS